MKLVVSVCDPHGSRVPIAVVVDDDMGDREATLECAMRGKEAHSIRDGQVINGHVIRIEPVGKRPNMLEPRTNLDRKIAGMSGRLQLIVAAMSRMSKDEGDSEDMMTEAVCELVRMAHDYGSKWLDNAACLLKELYNRTQGP